MKMLTTDGKRRKCKKRPFEKERFILKCPFWKDVLDLKGGPMKDERYKGARAEGGSTMRKIVDNVKQVLHKINAAITYGKYARGFFSLGLLLNLADAAFTLYYVGSGYAQEANPVVAYFLNQSPLAFFVMKMYLSAVCFGILYMYKECRSAMLGLYSAVGVYSAAVTMHVVWAIALLIGG